MAEEQTSPKTGDPRVGTRISPAMASITVAATTTMLHQITPGRVAIVRKVMWANRNTQSSRLQIGSTDAAAGGVGGTYTQRLPEIFMGAGLSGVVPEEELPNYEFRSLIEVNTDIVARATVAAVATADIQVSIEVEEIEL